MEVLYHMMLGTYVHTESPSTVSADYLKKYTKNGTLGAVPHPVNKEYVYFNSAQGGGLNWNPNPPGETLNITQICNDWEGIVCHERSDNGRQDTCWCVHELELDIYTWGEKSDSVHEACINKCKGRKLFAKSEAPLDAITKIALGKKGIVSVTQIPGVLEQLKYLEVLDASGNMFIGTVPKEIGNIKGLRLLDFSSNDLLGEFPSTVGQLKHLHVLKLMDSKLKGPIPDVLNELRMLQVLNLSLNELTGNFPDLSNLSKLTHIDFQGNQIDDKLESIAEDVAKMPKLDFLDLSYNSLDGTIPNVLGRCDNLKELILEENELSGTIPAEITNMKSLTHLDFNTNHLTGGLPGSTLAKTEELEDELGLDSEDELKIWSAPLQNINLSNNAFESGIPQGIFTDQLVSLILADNYFTERIPASVENSKDTLKEFQIQGNLLVGTMPKEIYLLTNLQKMEVYDNKLRGNLDERLCEHGPNSYAPFSCTDFIVCPKGYFHPKGHAIEMSGCAPCPDCHTEDLKDKRCRYIGQTHCGDQDTPRILEGDMDGDGIVSQREFIRLLWIAFDGENWHLGDLYGKWNDLRAYPHVCQLPRVNCKDGKISKIDLREAGLCPREYENNSCGLIPSEIGLLAESLEVLDMSNSRAKESNTFQLTLPTEIGLLTELKILDLSMNDLVSIPSAIRSCEKLTHLNLYQSELVGKVDSAIWSLSNLEALDLRENNFFNQKIPTEIGNLKNLVEFKNSRANFVGTVPTEICMLQKLKNLEIYGNKLNGEIPDCFSNFKNLSRLDIYGNQLTGTIEWLATLPALEIVHIGVNDFSGTIPKELGNMNFLAWVDMSENDIVGEVPSSLAALPNLVDLRLGGNALYSIPDEICQSKKINGGQVGDSCEHILCDIGMVSSRGYTFSQSECTECGDDETTIYLGQMNCLEYMRDQYVQLMHSVINGLDVADSISDSDVCNQLDDVECDENGDVISFNVPLENIDFNEAVFTSHATAPI